MGTVIQPRAKTAYEVLRDAKTFVEQFPWTPGLGASYAVNSAGTPVHWRSSDAVAWTPFGAIRKVSQGKLDDWVTAYSWIKMIIHSYGYDSVAQWNTSDGMTKEQVLRVFQEAIDKATPL
jgi:hypothetical protein